MYFEKTPSAIEFEEAYSKLIEYGASDEVLTALTSINGSTLNTLDDFCYYEFGGSLYEFLGGE